MAVIGLIVHEGRPAAAKSARDLSQWIVAAGHEVRLPPEEAVSIGYPHLEVDHDLFAEGLDIVVALGGDGSILRAVKLIGVSEVPILGVDFGRLGYLSEVQPCEARSAVEKVITGDFTIEDRLLLNVVSVLSHNDNVQHHEDRRVLHDKDLRATQETGEILETSPHEQHHLALNEAFIERGSASNTISLTVHLDDHEFTTYKADGLIVATPTGSTAYAFSARGPIIDPSHRALLLTPVSPHMLFDRSLVVPPLTRLRITVGGDRPAVLSVDGRRVTQLDANSSVECSASPCSARFIKFGERPFHQVLKAKFGLKGPPSDSHSSSGPDS